MLLREEFEVDFENYILGLSKEEIEEKTASIRAFRPDADAEEKKRFIKEEFRGAWCAERCCEESLLLVPKKHQNRSS